MSGWAIDCEWAFVGMKRDQAAQFYGQQFASFKTASNAHTASSALLIYTIVFFAAATILFSIFLVCVCRKPQEAPEASAACASSMVILGLLARIGWLITLSIMYRRINQSWDVAQENTKIASNLAAYFGQFATSCGDPLAAMNTVQATDVMDRAKLIAKDGYWFTGFTLVFMVVEFVVVTIYSICLGSKHKPTDRSSSYAEPSVPPAPSNDELELEGKQKDVNDA